MSGPRHTTRPFFSAFVYVVSGKIPSLLWNGRRNRDEKNLEHNSKFQQMIRKLLVLLLCLTAATATAKKPKSSASKKAESSAEKPKESDYDKLFKEKHTVADGMVPLARRQGEALFRDSRFAFRARNAARIDHFGGFGQRCGDDRLQVGLSAARGFHAQRPFGPAAYGQLREHHRRDGGLPRAGRGGEAEHGRSHPAQLQDRGLEPGQHGRGGQRHGPVRGRRGGDVALLEVRTLYGFRAEEDLPDGAFDAGRNQGFQRQCGGAQYVELYFHAHPRPHDAGQGSAADGRDDPVRWCCCPASLTVRASPTAACRCSRPARCFSASASSAPR